MSTQLVELQMQAHRAHRVRQARKRKAAEDLAARQREQIRKIEHASGFPTPIFPWPKPFKIPVYVDHNAHVISYRTEGMSFERIKQDVMLASGLPWHQIISSRRDFNTLKWRHAIIHACYKMTSMSLQQIGKHCGNKDHTTVLSGVRRVESAIQKGMVDELVSVTGLTFYVRNDYNGRKRSNC